MKLGTLLLRNAAVTLTQLEAALRAQVLYGGRMGTNLVELGFLDLDGLSAYLGELYGLPVATPQLLDSAPRKVLDLMGPDICDLYGLLPLGFLPPFPDALAIAMVDPRDDIALDAAHRKCGYAIAPYVIPELRALYYLEKHFGIARKARFIRAGTRRVLTIADERRKTQPPGGLVMPPKVRLEPRRRRTSISELTSALASEPPLSYPAACDRLDNAIHRDQIATALVEFAAGRFDALVLFLIRDGNALGWRGHIATPLGASIPLEELSLPLGGASAMQSAHDAARPFRGAPPSAAHPVESRLWQAIGAEPPPSEMMVTPIIVKQRVVNLIYVQAVGGGILPEIWCDELCELALRATAAYVRLISSRKLRVETQ